MASDTQAKPAVVMVLPPDGKFHSSDIWSILHRQQGGFTLYIIDRSGGAAKLLPAMAKEAVAVVRADDAPLGRQLNDAVRALETGAMVFFTDRVLPTHDHWIKRLTAPLAEGADVAFGRNITAPGGNYFIIEDLRKRYPQHGGSTALTLDNCAFRRAALVERPFPEDEVADPAAVWCWRGNAAPAYVPEALAMQDTYLTLGEVYRAACRFGADRKAAGKRHGLIGELCGALGEMAGDVGFCFTKAKPQYLWYPPVYRAAIHGGIVLGQWRGAWR